MKSFKNALAKPARESLPWAMWIWNLSLSQDELVQQLNALIDKGFGGIAVRPGRDMIPSYMSEEFLALFETTLSIAQERGVSIRIADDFSLPWSGAFESLLRQSSTYRAHYLVLKESVSVSAKNDFEREIPDVRNTVLIATKEKDGLINLSEVKILTPPEGKKTFSWKAPVGDWKVCVFKKEFIRDLADGYVPNILNPKAAQTYIQNVLEPLKTRFSKFVPGTFEGFINEMPAYRPAENSIPWDDDLVLKYRSKYKKDLLKLVPALFFDTDVPAGRLRGQIYSFIYQSMFERFASVLETWVKKYRLSQWTLAPETGIYKTANVLVDGMVPTEQQFATMGLQNVDGSAESSALLKMSVDTNVNQFRRETVTVVGRNRQASAATVQSLKSEIDLNLLNGFSRILIDGFFFNIDQRSYLKTPYNPFWYAPGWEHIKHLCEYAGRAQEMVRDIHFARQIAVFSPSPAIHGAYRPGNGEACRKGIGNLSRTLSELAKLNLDTDVVSEEQLLGCSVRTTGEFGTADRTRKGNYQVLVVPYAPFVSRSVLVFLEKIISRQGIILFIDEPPKGTFEDGLNASVTSRIEKLTSSKRSKGRVVQVNALEEALGGITAVASVKVQGKFSPDVRCGHGSAEGYELYVVENISDRQECTATLEVPSEKNYTCIDCDNGELIEIDEVERGPEKSKIILYLTPRRTFLITGSGVKVAAQGASRHFRHGINPFKMPQRNYRIVLKDQWTFEPSTLNVLPLSNWNVRIGLSRDSGGFSHFYESHFQAKILPLQCFLVLNGLGRTLEPNEGVVEVSVNGSRVDRNIPEPVQDAAPATGDLPGQEPVVPLHQVNLDTSIVRLFGSQTSAYPIKDLLIRGFNRVSLRTAGLVNDPQHLLYPPVVVGAFAVTKGSTGWAIDKSNGTVGHDSWTKYGYPYLSGMGTYRQSFEIPNDYERLVLRISQVSGSVDVKLNNKPLGMFHWHPIEIDITSLVEPKRNELTISVFNTIDNILRLNGRPSGLTGEVYLDVY